MLTFYKKNIEYITEHAVDPDKRRYATKLEAVRHYIDIDHWDTYPFENVPRKYAQAILKYSDVQIINERGDTTLVDSSDYQYYLEQDSSIIRTLEYQPDENPWSFQIENGQTLYIEDKFSEYGILP